LEVYAKSLRLKRGKEKKRWEPPCGESLRPALTR